MSEHLGEGHPRRLHLDVDGQRIGRVDGGALHVGEVGPGQDPLLEPGDVVGQGGAVERRAVVEGDARAGLHRPHRVVGVRREALEQVRRPAAVLVRDQHRVVDGLDDLMAREGADHLRRHPRRAGVGLDAHDHLATGRGLRSRCGGRAGLGGRSLAAAGRRGLGSDRATRRRRPPAVVVAAPATTGAGQQAERRGRRREQHQRALLRSTSLTSHLVPPRSLSSGSPERGRSPLSPAVTAATAACSAR